MKPNSRIKVKMSQIDWDVDDMKDLSGLPEEVELECDASAFEDALSYDPATDDYTFDEDVAADQLADLLSDEYGFCVNHIGDVEFSY
jgi:midasin (ATPase involved in ribosome maturation)